MGEPVKYCRSALGQQRGGPSGCMQQDNIEAYKRTLSTMNSPLHQLSLIRFVARGAGRGTIRCYCANTAFEAPRLFAHEKQLHQLSLVRFKTHGAEHGTIRCYYANTACEAPRLFAHKKERRANPLPLAPRLSRRAGGIIGLGHRARLAFARSPNNQTTSEQVKNASPHTAVNEAFYKYLSAS